MSTSAVCPRCGKSDVYVIPLEVLPEAYYTCRDCGHVWKISSDPPATVDDPQDPSREHVNPPIPNCPNCLTPNGQLFEVEEHQGYRRVSYCCGKCQYIWTERIPVPPETPPR